VDDLLVGRGFRALRKRRGWTQSELATRAGAPQSTVSLIERGRLELVRVPTLRRVGRELGIVVEIGPRWPIADVARLLDADHARLTEVVVRVLRGAGWEAAVEYTFNDFGDRGSVDILAWHPVRRALLIVEIKTRVVDIQDLHAAIDRKVRVVPKLVAKERGWRAAIVGKLLVVKGTDANRDGVRRHAATFDATFPSRSRAARRWIGDPIGPLAALWFVGTIDSTDRIGCRELARKQNKAR
jgi:transcriptional regulator with XRE-family HTH domain